MLIMEGCYSRDPQVLLALVVEEWDMCCIFLPVEDVDTELLYLLDNDDREGTAVDRRPYLGEGG